MDKQKGRQAGTETRLLLTSSRQIGKHTETLADDLTRSTLALSNSM